MDGSKPGSRLLALDALRGLAVLLMIEQHLGVWLWKGPGRGEALLDYPLLLGFNALGGLAAPAFIVLAGTGSSLLVESRPTPDKTVIGRGLTVLALGYLLSLATPSWFSWRSWFVLHLMGVGIASMPLWRRLSTATLLGIALAILCATPWAQAWLETPTALSNERMAGILSASKHGGVRVLDAAPLRLALVEGHFPVLPWLAAFLVGVATGRLVKASSVAGIARLGSACVALGGVLAAVSLLSPAGSATPLSRATRLNVPFFPASPAEVLLLAGAIVLAIALALRLESRRLLHERGVLVVLGRASLTLLLLHVVMFRELTRPLGLWQAVSPAAALATILGFCLLAALAARAWQRVGYRGGAEWLLRKLAP